MLLWTSGCMCLFELGCLFSSDVYPEMELLDHMVVLFLVFWGNSILFPIVAAPIYIPTNSEQVFPFLPILTTFVICGLFDDSHSDKCEVIYHCGVDLHSCDDRWCWASFHVPVGHLYVFFGEKCLIQVFAHF